MVTGIRKSLGHGTIGAAQGILALVLICVGVGMFSVPAAFIVAGALLLIDRVL
jgi:hypothetical protein